MHEKFPPHICDTVAVESCVYVAKRIDSRNLDSTVATLGNDGRDSATVAKYRDTDCGELCYMCKDIIPVDSTLKIYDPLFKVR